MPYLDRHFGNPSSVHAAGRETRAAIDNARDKLAALLRAHPHELIFTSGGTESCNLAVSRSGAMSIVARWPCHLEQSGTSCGPERARILGKARRFRSDLVECFARWNCRSRSTGRRDSARNSASSQSWPRIMRPVWFSRCAKFRRSVVSAVSGCTAIWCNRLAKSTSIFRSSMPPVSPRTNFTDQRALDFFFCEVACRSNRSCLAVRTRMNDAPGQKTSLQLPEWQRQRSGR